MLDAKAITDPRTADAFLSGRQRKIVQSLMKEELSLSALARITKLPLNLLTYHVATVMKLGLVEIVRVKRRAGRPVKFYRATARSFFVPADLMTELPSASITREFRKALDRGVARTLRGFTFTYDDTGPRAHLVSEPKEHTGTLELWLDRRLSKADAQELAKELQSVIDKYRARANEKGVRYMVHAAMTAM